MTTLNGDSMVQQKLTPHIIPEAMEGVYPIRPSDPEKAIKLYQGLDSFPCEAGFYQSYILRCCQEEATAPGQIPIWRFIVREISEEQQQWKFDSFDQVVDFLLDKLMKEQK